MKLGGQRQTDEPELNLIPLIDVMITLIIFFVVTTSFNQRSALKLQLPSAQASTQTEPGEPLTVLVDAEGKYFVGSMEVLKTDTASLKEAIAQVAGSRRDMPVVLRADARSPHQSVVTAMDALGQLGFVRLSHRYYARGKALMASADSGGDGHKSAWQVYRRLLGYAGRYRVFLLVATVGMVFEAVAAGAFTYLMKPMVDETFVARNPDVRWSLPLAIIGLFMLRGVATFVTDYGMARSGRSVVRDLREAVLAKFLRMPSARFDIEAVPTLVSRLNYDTEQVSTATSEAIKVTITDALTIVVLLGVMLSQSMKVTLALLVIAPAIGIISSQVGQRYRRINRGIQDGVGKMAQAAEEALAAQQEVKINGTQQGELARYSVLANRILGLNMKVESTRASASSIVQLLAAFALAAILWVAGQEAIEGHMTAGAFVTLMTAMMLLLPSLKRITNIQGAIQRGVAACDRLFSLLDEPDEVDAGRLPLARARGELEFRSVAVQYAAQDRPALSDVSFRASAGTVTAIVGRSGSGKSTLIRLIPRFYEACAGEVLLDGQRIDGYALADLRRQIALVGQRVMLFDESIAANIAYGQGDAGPERIRAAANAANASEFIDRLPEGMDTRIGENGGLLSGGQRQRLAIARAILKDAPILILDEATAALDNESERLVQDALNHLIPDRTTLVIAHRLSTVEHADQVLVLDDGRLVEQGTHLQLLAQGGLYAHLHRMQFREPEEG